MNSSDYSSQEKVAILLLSFGEDLASEVLSCLAKSDVQAITKAMVQMERVSADELYPILLELEQQLLGVGSSTVEGGYDVTKKFSPKLLAMRATRS